MTANITGKIVEILAERSGVSKSGNEWVSQEFVIEEEGGDKIVFSVFGRQKLDEYNLKVGTTAAVTLKIESTKWNDKYFMKASCINCVSNSKQTETTAPRPITPQRDQYTPYQSQPAFDNKPETEITADQLPF